MARVQAKPKLFKMVASDTVGIHYTYMYVHTHMYDHLAFTDCMMNHEGIRQNVQCIFSVMNFQDFQSSFYTLYWIL